jgi:GTPase SAR1 family protein
LIASSRLGEFAVEVHDDPRVPVLPLEGVGGAGKSTLLAALVRSELGRDDPAGAGPIIIQADFDRLIFRNGGELELSFEVARQIGVQVPEVDRPLRGLADDKLAQRAALSEEMKQEGAALESMIRIAAVQLWAGSILSASLSTRGRCCRC